MLQLLADRFLCDRGRWFDLATARPVSVRLSRAGDRQAQYAWSDRCAALSRLRHPLLNPLLDYGFAAAHATFEAYALSAPLRTGTVAGSRATTHLVRFLRAHGVTLGRELADVVVRPLLPGGRSGRPLGIVLQHRRVVDALTEALESGGTGPAGLTVCGPPLSGISTLKLTFARRARLAGYLPVAMDAIRRWPTLPDVTMGRHVCVLSEDASVSDAAARACWLTRLGLESSRHHVYITFVRAADVSGALCLDPLGVSSMRSMIYCDPDFGPSVREVLAGVRVADGWPGRFLRALDAEPFQRASDTRGTTVHESSVPYVVTPPPEGATAARSRGRLADVLVRADRRAAALARAGRHGAALRLVNRAARLFEARGAPEQAAACVLRGAWILRSRGDLERAEGEAERARRISRDPAVHAAAATAAGIIRTDAGRLIESEAALRAAAAAATSVCRADLTRRANLALARALLWRERPGEALASLEGLSDEAFPEVACEALALASRIHTAGGDVAGALGAASQALRRSTALPDPRVRAAAHRAMAAGLLLAGDLDGAASHVHSGLRAAAEAHLPLTSLRIRALGLIVLRRRDPADAACRRQHDRLQSALRHRLPYVIRTQIESACEPGRQSSVVWPAPRAVDEREVVAGFVDAAQRAPDEGAALACVLERVSERLQPASCLVVAGDAARVLAAVGRPWRERSPSARRALDAGGVVPLDRAMQPPEAAVPVKYAGNTIAALACRWPAGCTPDAAAVTLYLEAAALAVSPHVHALLDVREPTPQAVWGDLIGDSTPAAALRDAVLRAARAPFPVLIEGESGSGKELVARAVHRFSPRRERRFCAINCAAITDELVEAELFGHARGAFTGASSERPGLFEEADGGSLFLDEVGELSARAQAKLLRVLQEGEVRRVGENFPRRVDVRVIAATNRRLEEEVTAGRFRVDLRFRLDVVRITVPPLRERSADIPALAAHFWREAASRVGSRATIGPDALSALARYDWPGNVRELQNAIACMAVHAPLRGRIGASLLPARLAAAAIVPATFEAAREEFERRFVRAALARTGGHRGRTAQALGVSRQGLAKMMRRLKIEDG